MISRIIEPKRLRVVHVAAQAYPFDQSKGLSQVAGKVPAALARLGVETLLILPLSRLTKEYIQAHGLQLEEKFRLSIPHGAKSIDPVEVQALRSPLEPGYPVYFIANEELFGKFENNEMYGWANDLERFAVYCKATLALMRRLGENKPENAPEVINCHDWQAALIPIYLDRIVTDERFAMPARDRFFGNTRTVFTAHDFRKGFTGEFEHVAFHQAGLGWEWHLPVFTEFHRNATLLKGALYTADRASARSFGFLELVKSGVYGGQKHLPEIIAERMQEGKKEGPRLVGIFSDDKEWSPAADLTEELALAWAKRELALYRSLVDRPFPGMELAEQTSPPLPYRVFTPQEDLKAVSGKTWELYEKLSKENKILVDKAILAGEGSRFARVEKEEDLDNILSFLKIETEPGRDFEQRMKEDGLGDFLAPFLPGDINRLLSLKIDLRICKELLPSLPEAERKGKITLLEAFSALEEADNTRLLDHILSVFRALKLISSAPNKSEADLAATLGERGELVFEGGLSSATSEFRQLSEVFGYISRKEGLRFYRAFIVGVLIHDLGKLVKHRAHALEGAKLLEKMQELRGLLGKDELEFAKRVIMYHSLFGDTFILREQDPDDIEEMYSSSKNKKHRDRLVKCLYLLGIADMDASGRKGRLSPRKIINVRKAYEMVLYAKTQSELKKSLEEMGFGLEKEGINRWKRWVVRERDAREVRDKDSDLAFIELKRHCLRKIEPEIASLGDRLKGQVLTKKQKKRAGKALQHKVGEMADEYTRQLGAIGDIRKIEGIIKKIEENKLRALGISEPPATIRARLLIWLIEYSRVHPKYGNFSFEFSYKNTAKFDQEITKLCHLLDEFNLEKIERSLLLTYDEEQNTLEISI